MEEALCFGCNEPDNMRGFDPASEDDMDDRSVFGRLQGKNDMSRYMENNDEEGWDQTKKYSPEGIRRSCLQPGLNIIRYSNGNSKKI